MLNYISAELYKLRRKKSLYTGMVVLLALEGLLFVPIFWVDDIPLAGELVVFLNGALPFGLFLAPAFAVLDFDNQYGYASL